MDEDFQYLALLSPGMPLPQTGPDFLPDVSWATDSSWDLFPELQLEEQHGERAAQIMPAQEAPVSPPTSWPANAPPLFDPTAESLVLPASEPTIFEGKAGTTFAPPSGSSYSLSAQGGHSSTSLLSSRDPSYANLGDKGAVADSEPKKAAESKKANFGSTGPSWGRERSKRKTNSGSNDCKSVASAAPIKPAGGRIRKRVRKQLPVAVKQVKFPAELPRMSPQCLKNAHKREIEPEQLLQQAMLNVSPGLFARSNNPAEDYTNLEEFSVVKSTQSDGPPFIVATSSIDAAEMVRDVWSAQRSTHLGTVMLRPPQGPKAPTTCLLQQSESDQNAVGSLQSAVQFARNGVAASPKHCQGLPRQCASWVNAPDVPQTPLKTDFALMSRNIGKLRRSGYLHVLTSSQLSCIAAMPGSIAVRFLLIMSTLLGQPLVGSARPVHNNETMSPPLWRQPVNMTGTAHHLPLLQARRTDNPQPAWGWNPNADFQKHTVHLGDTDITLLMGHLPAVQITLPTTQRQMLRLDRIVDLKEISALQYNALRWTRNAMEAAAPITRDGFRILEGYENDASSVEYYLHGRPISAPDCEAMALAKQGRLPMSELEVKYATATLNWPQMMWTKTVQESAASNDKFHYRLQLGGRPLLPAPADGPACQIYHVLHGEAKLISTDGIGAQYIWYQHSGLYGQYHVYNPWYLAAAMATNGSCTIFVPPAPHTKLPPQYLQRCLILRNGSMAATNRRQLRSAVALQQSRLMAIEGLPCEARLENQERSLGPLHIDAARVIQPLHAGPERLLLESSQQALQPGLRDTSLSPKDFRTLRTKSPDPRPQPTPAALLAVGSTLLATAGNFLVSGVTQDIVTDAMSKIAAAGKYRYIDPILLSRAVTARDRKTYLSSVNSVQRNGSYTWDEEEGILLLKDLQTLGHIPSSAASDEAQLASGLAIVTAAADTLEQFNIAGLQQMEAVALNFLASTDLHIDSEGGALCYVLRSGSVALASYYLSTIDSSPALLTHRLHGLPAFQGTKPDKVISIDLPTLFRLTHLPVDVNSTAAQSSCARALTSQEYEAALGSNHPACVTKEDTRVMVSILHNIGQTRIIQTTSAPEHKITVFLACSGAVAKRFKLHSEVNLFVLPAHCTMDLSLASKLKSIHRLHSEQAPVSFQWMLAYNTSAYDRPLTKAEEVYIALYSVGGALGLFALLSAGLLFKFKQHLPCLRTKKAAHNTYVNYDKATIYHPHLGPRSLSDFSSSTESVNKETTQTRPQPRPSTGAINPFLPPSALRDYTRFAGYTATVRRTPRQRASVQEVRVPATVHQPGEAEEETKL